MNETPQDPRPESTPPSTPAEQSAPPPPYEPSRFERGCGFVFMTGAGFAGFALAGAAVLSASRGTKSLGIGYLVVALIGGIILATRPGLRGLGVGLLLGVGAVLLLISICGGM
jgi:hypothetical protein